ncbi:LOW QUALITY PROTEIN: myosin light chain 5 [Acanthochromis polyacanthus]|uniref:LOW QUALITY PROTEIN: myosin light chain 5 n=1 Tax=Acanthochromis polyacanthus TaxID=80966 RepID=UPI0022347D48|nr:LOW QUALITY PROTEIN: myosin light chain 5 [Acanthochromis polyacanthus]
MAQRRGLLGNVVLDRRGGGGGAWETRWTHEGTGGSYSGPWRPLENPGDPSWFIIIRQLLYLKSQTKPAELQEEPEAQMASRKTKKKEGGAKRAQRASSNVFSMFEQTQIQEFKEAFTLIDQNRDGFIDQEDLKDTYALSGSLNVKDRELEEMLKEASGPINFTMFLNLFGEKLHGTDPEETILNAFKMFDPEAKGSIHKDELQNLLMTQADKFTAEEVKQMFASSNIDAAGNLDYKSLCYIITHGEEE